MEQWTARNSTLGDSTQGEPNEVRYSTPGEPRLCEMMPWAEVGGITCSSNEGHRAAIRGRRWEA